MAAVTKLQSKLKSPNSSESSESSTSSKELNVILKPNKEERLGRPKVPKNAASKIKIDTAAQTEIEYGLYSKPKNELERIEKNEKAVYHVLWQCQLQTRHLQLAKQIQEMAQHRQR